MKTGIGPVAVRQPRVRDREAAASDPGRIRFSPTILPPYMRRSKSIETLLPILYLKGISTGDFSEALAALLGKDASGLSASAIGRLKDDHTQWQKRDLCSGRLINSFALIYPADKRYVFDPIVERVEDTFRPGRDCERAELSTPSPARDSPLPPYRPRERSAMADRIARERGHDVIVTLRRTNPP